MRAPPASPCLGGPLPSTYPTGSGGAGMTETLNNLPCQRGRRQNEQIPWMVLTNPLRRLMPSAALSHSGIGFSIKQNLTCKEPNLQEEYWCLTLECWILTFLLRNNGSFCPACMAFPPTPSFLKHSKYSGQHFEINQLSYKKKWHFTCSIGQRKHTQKRNDFSHMEQRILNIHSLISKGSEIYWSNWSGWRFWFAGRPRPLSKTLYNTWQPQAKHLIQLPLNYHFLILFLYFRGLVKYI